MESILDSIKKQIGITPECTDFDDVLITHINSAFFTLSQLGVGPTIPFSITDKSAIWTDFMADISNFQAVKSYMYLKVQLLFDPPSGSAIADAKNRQISELEWRLNVAAESKKTESWEGF